MDNRYYFGNCTSFNLNYNTAIPNLMSMIRKAEYLFIAKGKAILPNKMTVSDIDNLPLDHMNQFYKTYWKMEKHGKKVKRRLISMVDSAELSALHKSILNTITLPSIDRVHSYKTGYSSNTCASNHIDKYAIFAIDISNFFPSITREIVKYLYKTGLEEFMTHLEGQLSHVTISNYEKEISIIKGKIDIASSMLAVACTIYDENIDPNNAILPVGTIVAPNISNFVLTPVDRDIMNLSNEWGYRYDRYSDNIFISSDNEHIDRSFQEKVIEIITNFVICEKRPFKVNTEKTKYMPYWKHQRILGIVVNKKANISKRREGWFRSAMTHLYYDAYVLLKDIESGNIINANRKLYNIEKRARVVFGNLSYIKSVNKEKYDKYYTDYIIIRLVIFKLKADSSLMYNMGGK